MKKRSIRKATSKAQEEEEDIVSLVTSIRKSRNKPITVESQDSEDVKEIASKSSKQASKTANKFDIFSQKPQNEDTTPLKISTATTSKTKVKSATPSPSVEIIEMTSKNTEPKKKTATKKKRDSDSESEEQITKEIQPKKKSKTSKDPISTAQPLGEVPSTTPFSFASTIKSTSATNNEINKAATTTVAASSSKSSTNTTNTANGNTSTSAPSSSTTFRKSSRYFEESTTTAIKLDYGSKSDFIKNCKQCGSSQHSDRDCPNIFCFCCNRLGHDVKQCPFNKTKMVCGWCQKPGHSEEDCTYKKFCLEAKHIPSSMQCFVCGKQGHLNCTPAVRSVKDISCFQCGRFGHGWSDCKGKSFEAMLDEEFEQYHFLEMEDEVYNKELSKNKNIAKHTYFDQNWKR